jgi:hypothetical protein
MDAQTIGKRLVSPLTDDEIGRIISLKGIGCSTIEISRILSRNQSDRFLVPGVCKGHGGCGEG